MSQSPSPDPVGTQFAVSIAAGFAEAEREPLSRLYWEAFGDKLGRVLGPGPKALTFVARSLSPAHALVARSGGEPVGLAGFRDYEGALVDISLGPMLGVYGVAGALGRSALLGLRHRDTDNRRFLVDGLAVAEAHRGRGIGSRLIEALAGIAQTRGHPAIRLDVADGNDGARRLYERRGFRAVQRLESGPLDRLAGGAPLTVMERRP